MNDDVDLILPEDSEIRPRRYRGWSAEEDVADIGAEHGASPAISQGCSHRLSEDMLRILISPHIGSVH